MTRMTLHPQCRALLDGFVAAWPAIDYSRIQATELRTLLSGPSPFAPGDDVQAITEPTIDGPGGALRLRLYRPHGGSGALPITLYFHGGGFTCGPVEGHDNVCRTLAQRALSLVVSVDYRLAPEAPFPAATQDALAALKWVHAHAGFLGGDAARLAVAGDSAGANLATVLAHQARGTGITLKHQVLLYPVTDARFDTASYRDFAQGYLLSREMMQWYWRQYLPDPAMGADPAASPLRQTELSGMPAATVIIAGFDPLRDEGLAYAQALRGAGVPVDVKVWEDQIHGFASMLGALDGAAEALDYCAAALARAWV
jgi:acetyl esterase